MIQRLSGIVDKARALERQPDFLGAIRQWENLRSIYPRYPGLQDELSRLRDAFQKLRTERKLAIVKKIEEALESDSLDLSGNLLKEAETEFPGDEQLTALRLLRERRLEKLREVECLVNRAREATKYKRFADTAKALSEAIATCSDIASLRRSVFHEALAQAEGVSAFDWRTAKVILEQAAGVDPELSVPPSHWENIRARERDEAIQTAFAEAIQAKTAGDLLAAQAILEKSLEHYPDEPRTEAELASIKNAIAQKRRKEKRDKDLNNLLALDGELRQTEISTGLNEFVLAAKSISEPYTNDPEFMSAVRSISDQIATHDAASASLSQDNVKDCLRICSEALTRYPDSRLF